MQVFLRTFVCSEIQYSISVHLKMTPLKVAALSAILDWKKSGANFFWSF